MSLPPTLGSARCPQSGLTSCAGVQGSCSSTGAHAPPPPTGCSPLLFLPGCLLFSTSFLEGPVAALGVLVPKGQRGLPVHQGWGGGILGADSLQILCSGGKKSLGLQLRKQSEPQLCRSVPFVSRIQAPHLSQPSLPVLGKEPAVPSPSRPTEPTQRLTLGADTLKVFFKCKLIFTKM